MNNGGVRVGSIGAGGRRATAVGLALALVLSSCTRGDDDDDDSAPTTTIETAVAPIDEPVINIGGPETGTDAPSEPPLDLELGDAEPTADVPDEVDIVDGEPLSDDEIAAAVDRLPPSSARDPDTDEVVLPPGTLPPPLPGSVVDEPFPPPADEPTTDVPTGPLEVLRYQPEGEVDVAPFLAVTFDQPMVPLATLDQLDAAEVPVVVTPAIDGQWRWIGTRTLQFEVEPGDTDRLPAATDYRVEIPSGTESATGGVLEQAVTWSFSTPAPQVRSFTGESDSLPLDPVFVAVFDQLVDGDAVLDTIEVSTADGRSIPIRLATDDEIDADDEARRTVADALDGRWVAFRPQSELPVDTALTVQIGPGTPSAEGPRVSETSATYRVRTFGTLTVTRHTCNYDSDCVPGAPFVFEFNNPLDPEAFSADLVAVAPDVPGLTINVYGNVLELVGATTGNSSYTVTLDGALRDTFGQTLGEPTEFTFEVGAARPVLRGFDRQWVTTDPVAETPQISVVTVNHDSVHVTAWAVSPTDVDSFRTYYDAQFSDTEPSVPDWTEVLDTDVDIDANADEIVETSIDLSEAFQLSGGQLVVRVEPTRDFSPDDDDYWSNRPTVAWVQTTTLGVDAILDDDELLIWTTDLVTGAPVGGVPVELIGDGRVATTDEEGLVRLAIGDGRISGLYADVGDRASFLAASWFDGWQQQELGDEGRWYVFDDRGIYRPGETARITGWVRRVDPDDDALLALYDDTVEVSYRVFDPQGNELATGTAPLNALGGFNVSVDIPENANLGDASIEFGLTGLDPDTFVSSFHTFQIQEFRTPEFEVTARSLTPDPLFADEPATVAVDAEYFAGGPLPDADVEWLVSSRETTYRPPNRDDFEFGVWQPVWWVDNGGFEADVGGFGADVGGFGADVAFDGPCLDCGEIEYEEYSGRTGPDGTHRLEIDFSGPDVDLPSSVTAEATVFDVNRQAWAARTDLLVHPARLYVGLRNDRNFVEQGTPIRVDGMVTDVDGAVVTGRSVEVTAGRLEWTIADGVWSEQLAETQTCTFTSTDDPDDGSMSCDFTTNIGGRYQITAVVEDDEGGRNRTEITQWVTGGQQRPSRSVELEEVMIVPDRESYEPGETAELLVQAPFSPANGIMTVIHGGIVSSEPFEAETGSAVLELPIEDANVPGLTVQVDMVGSSPRFDDDGNPLPDTPDRPAYATGRLTLDIPPVTRELDVVATPADDGVEPGTDTSVAVSVTGPDGEAVAGADVAVVVVDEAVLALTGYELDDPLDVLYADIFSDVTTEYMRSTIELTRSDLLAAVGDESEVAASTSADDSAEMSEDMVEEAGDADAGSDGAARSSTPPIDVRDDFEPLAVYAPAESTGDDGTVTVDVPLPDSLTRYRVTAVAVNGANQFGKGESTITARLPLMVRPSAPRFANFGDSFELPAVVQNQTDEPLEVDVALETSNLSLTGSAGQRVTVPANDRVEVRFPATTDNVGTAQVRVVAVSGSMSDAAEFEFPVYTPATAEAFATYGVVDEGAVGQPLVAPTGVIPEIGGLEIGTSSTSLQALTDAVLYLVDYRYDSADGYASRIMAVAALRDVLDAFDAAGLPDPDELNAQVDDDIARLVALQNDDGGFPYWQRGRPSIPFVSVQATHALVLADQAGYDVPGDALGAALAHIADIEAYMPSDYDQDVRDTISAYALYVRGLAGDGDTRKAGDLYARAGDDLQLDALAWIWPSIVDEEARSDIEREFANRAVETAGAATFATDYGEGAYLIAESDRRTDGVILDALISESPDSDLIPKVVAGLLGNQTRGRWDNVQENSFILLALESYFDTFEAVTPDFVARAWLGDLYAVEHEFLGRSTERAATVVPMSDVIGIGDTDLVIQKDGVGRLYYRLGVRYAPADLVLEPRDEGFVVDRVYEAVDDPDDVKLDADGSWNIRAGATVRVKLTMVADARRTHVALTDPLPAGLEPLNPGLTVTQTIPPPEQPDGGPEPLDTAADSIRCSCFNWFEHQNLRDDRAEAFTSLLPGGTYEYTYVARATTPGEFVVPPARAEEIYAPEVFGRSGSATVVVE